MLCGGIGRQAIVAHGQTGQFLCQSEGAPGSGGRRHVPPGVPALAATEGVEALVATLVGSGGLAPSCGGVEVGVGDDSRLVVGGQDRIDHLLQMRARLTKRLEVGMRLSLGHRLTERHGARQREASDGAGHTDQRVERRSVGHGLASLTEEQGQRGVSRLIGAGHAGTGLSQQGVDLGLRLVPGHEVGHVPAKASHAVGISLGGRVEEAGHHELVKLGHLAEPAVTEDELCVVATLKRGVCLAPHGGGRQREHVGGGRGAIGRERCGLVASAIVLVEHPYIIRCGSVETHHTPDAGARGGALVLEGLQVSAAIGTAHGVNLKGGPRQAVAVAGCPAAEPLVKVAVGHEVSAQVERAPVDRHGASHAIDRTDRGHGRAVAATEVVDRADAIGGIARLLQVEAEERVVLLGCAAAGRLPVTLGVEALHNHTVRELPVGVAPGQPQRTVAQGGPSDGGILHRQSLRSVAVIGVIGDV